MTEGNKIFEDIYLKERKFSRMMILTIVKNEDIAEDICGDVFARLYEMGEELDMSDRGRVHSLITTMSYNKAIDYLRKSSVKLDTGFEENRVETPDERYNPEAVILRMEEDEYAKLILQKLRRKNPMNYDILVKVKYVGLSPASVAEEYGITVNNVNNRLLRTKRWFLKELKKLYKD